MIDTNIKKWATSAVAAHWPQLFRWTYGPIVRRRQATGPRWVVLGRDIYLEDRESPTTIWRLDPILAAALASGMMGHLAWKLSASAGRFGSVDTGPLTTGSPRHDQSANAWFGKERNSTGSKQASAVARTAPKHSAG